MRKKFLHDKTNLIDYGGIWSNICNYICINCWYILCGIFIIGLIYYRYKTVRQNVDKILTLQKTQQYINDEYPENNNSLPPNTNPHLKYNMQDADFVRYQQNQSTSKNMSMINDNKMKNNEHTPNDYSQREHTPNDYSQREHTPNDYSQREHTPNDYSQREHTPTNYSQREHTPNDYSQREHTPTNYSQREHTPNDYSQREHTPTNDKNIIESLQHRHEKELVNAQHTTKSKLEDKYPDLYNIDNKSSISTFEYNNNYSFV